MKKFIAYISIAFLIASCDTSLTSSDSRDAIEGSWTCKEEAGQAYQVSISKAPLEEDKLYFNNFYNIHENIEVIISGNTLSIPTQSKGNFTFNGSGNVSADKRKITLSFKADGSSVNASLTKN